MPSIPVGTQTAASASRRMEFECRRCGHRAACEVVGIGEGVQSFLNSPGTAERRAREDAEKDILRTFARARCPKCKLRNPGAAFRFFWPYLLGSAGGMLLGLVAGYAPTWFDLNMRQHDRDICKWVMPLIFFVSLLLVVAAHHDAQVVDDGQPRQMALGWNTEALSSQGAAETDFWGPEETGSGLF